MFLVIELWPGPEVASIVVDEMSGKNKIFEDRELAERGRKKCQNGIIVEF